MPKSFLINLGYPEKLNEIDKKEKLNIMKNEENTKFPQNINFTWGNYIGELKEAEKYDTILCMSTVKWIHLNYGDIGVKILFYNIYKQLKPNGLFVFEPQPWHSFKKKKNLNPTIKNNFLAIKLKPHQYINFLIETFGFKLISHSIPPPNSKKSFDRPIYVLQKNDR
jgi:7SK snRNA methylphosphate capping enzyme